MLFISEQENYKIERYKKLLKILGSLSNLFSDSPNPYLNYRVSENLFCKVFEAKNLSRSDVSADASKDGVGVGLKTFLENNGSTLQKIAEFNKDRDMYKEGSTSKIIQVITRLRNERVLTTKRIHKLDNIIYHCVVRNEHRMKIFEVNMDIIAEQKLREIKKDGNVIRFTDDLNEYSFNISKSTLYKRFNTPKDLIEVDVDILSDPFEVLDNVFGENKSYQELKVESIRTEESWVALPLYSTRNKKVPSRSGLNQWNAKGRPRDPNEIYIPIPSWIHKKFPQFFPSRDQAFKLELPDGFIMKAKLCQDNRKALMSNPNKALGKWLLRDVLNLKERELLTYQKLKEIGLDSVVIYKLSDNKYQINFTKIDTFENFKEKILMDKG